MTACECWTDLVGTTESLTGSRLSLVAPYVTKDSTAANVGIENAIAWLAARMIRIFLIAIISLRRMSLNPEPGGRVSSHFSSLTHD